MNDETTDLEMDIINKEMNAVNNMLLRSNNLNLQTEVIMSYTNFIRNGNPIIASCQFALLDWDL